MIVYVQKERYFETLTVKTPCPYCDKEPVILALALCYVEAPFGLSVGSRCTGYAHCPNCNNEIPQKQWDESIRNAFKSNNKKYKLPAYKRYSIWVILGIMIFFTLLGGPYGLIFGLAIWWIYAEIKNKQYNKSDNKNPEKNKN